MFGGLFIPSLAGAADSQGGRAAGRAGQGAVHATVVGVMRNTPAGRCCIAQAACTSL